MIIYYRYITDIAISPPELDARLVIDANAVEPFQIPFQRFETIGWGTAKIL